MKKKCTPEACRPILAMVLLAMVSACGPANKISATWKDPEYSETKNKLLVVALTHDEDAKTTVEETFKAILEESGVEATKSSALFEPEDLPDLAIDTENNPMFQRIHDNGNDAVMTVALLHQETTTRHKSKISGYYSPSDDYDFYGGFHSYYHEYYTVATDPGYYQRENAYFLESNLYDVETKALIWSAQSEVYNPRSLESFAEVFANITVAQMKGEDIID